MTASGGLKCKAAVLFNACASPDDESRYGTPPEQAMTLGGHPRAVHDIRPREDPVVAGPGNGGGQNAYDQTGEKTGS